MYRPHADGKTGETRETQGWVRLPNNYFKGGAFLLKINKADKKVMSLGDKVELVHHNIVNLLSQNDNIVKLLSSESPDCLDIEINEETRDKIFDEENRDKCRVFRAPFVPKTEEVSCAQLRIYTPIIKPTTEFTADIFVVVDVIVDLEVNRLTKGQRWFRLLSEILDTISGKSVGGIGRLQLLQSNIPLTCFKENFWGYSVPFQVKAGTN